MKNLILLLFLISTMFVVAQRDEVFVNDATEVFTNSLLERGISQFFTTKRYCLGKTEVFKMPDESICFSKGTYIESYIIWVEFDRYLIKKIDNCGLFQTVSIEDGEAHNYFFENIEGLKTNKVKPYKIRKQEHAPLLRTAIKSCRRSFTIYDGQTVSPMIYNTWDVESSEISANLNFEYNDAL